MYDLMSEFWSEILERFDSVSKALQNPHIVLNEAVGLLFSLIGYLKQKRDVFDGYERQAIEKVYKAAERRVHHRNGCWDPGTGEETHVAPREWFKTQVFLTTIDNLLQELNRRLDAYSVMSEKFGFLCHLHELSHDELQASTCHVRHFACQRRASSGLWSHDVEHVTKDEARRLRAKRRN